MFNDCWIILQTSFMQSIIVASTQIPAIGFQPSELITPVIKRAVTISSELLSLEDIFFKTMLLMRGAVFLLVSSIFLFVGSVKGMDYLI